MARMADDSVGVGRIKSDTNGSAKSQGSQSSGSGSSASTSRPEIPKRESVPAPQTPSGASSAANSGGRPSVGESVGVGRSGGVSDGGGEGISGGKAVIAAQGAASAGAVGGGAYILGKIGSFFTGLATTVAGAVSGAVTGVASFIAGAVSAVVGMFGTIGAIIVAGGSVLGGVLVIGTLALTMVASDEQQKVGALEDCATGVSAIERNALQEGDMESNAMKIYDALVAYGVDDLRIAGCLGNLQTESSIDPTCIEGFYGAGNHYTMSAEKLEAAADLNSYCLNNLFPRYDASGVSYSRPAYQVASGDYVCGIGMAQYTAEGAYTLWRTAESVGQEWYSLDFAIAYLINGNYRGGARFWDTWLAASNPSSAEDAAYYFAAQYEGNTTNAQAQRKQFASEWYARMAGWSADLAYGNSILDLAATLSDAALDATVANKLESCKKMKEYDNSTIAQAAVSFAWPTKAQGEGNNGTGLYQAVNDNTIGDHIYMSCDRTICSAIRWSGSDDTFPPGNSNYQVDYMNDSSKWDYLGTSATLSVSDLQPGDVFGLYGHVFIFVGHEAIEEVHGSAADANSDSVSGSYMERSPGCGDDASDIIVRMGGQDWIGRGAYQIFRCVNPDNSTTYADAGAGAS